jgi:hypothetical protein
VEQEQEIERLIASVARIDATLARIWCSRSTTACPNLEIAPRAEAAGACRGERQEAAAARGEEILRGRCRVSRRRAAALMQERDAMIKEPPRWSPDAVSGTVLMEYLQRVSPQFVAAELDQLGLLEAADRAAATVLLKLEAPRRLAAQVRGDARSGDVRDDRGAGAHAASRG